MFGGEKFYVAPMASRTGFPVFLEFPNPSTTMKDPNKKEK